MILKARKNPTKKVKTKLNIQIRIVFLDDIKVALYYHNKKVKEMIKWLVVYEGF